MKPATSTSLTTYPVWKHKRSKTHDDMNYHDELIIQILETAMLVEADLLHPLPYPCRRYRGQDLFKDVHFTAEANGIVVRPDSDEAANVLERVLTGALGIPLLRESESPRSDRLITYETLRSPPVRHRLASIIVGPLGVSVSPPSHADAIDTDRPRSGHAR